MTNLYWYGNSWYAPYADYLAAFSRIRELERSLVELRKVDEADASNEATAPFEAEETDAKSDDVRSEDVRSDYSKGYDAGFSEGYDHAKAEILISIVKAVNLV